MGSTEEYPAHSLRSLSAWDSSGRFTQYCALSSWSPWPLSASSPPRQLRTSQRRTAGCTSWPSSPCSCVWSPWRVVRESGGRLLTTSSFSACSPLLKASCWAASLPPTLLTRFSWLLESALLLSSLSPCLLSRPRWTSLHGEVMRKLKIIVKKKD